MGEPIYTEESELVTIDPSKTMVEMGYTVPWSVKRYADIISWSIQFRNGKVKRFRFPVRRLIK